MWEVETPTYQIPYYGAVRIPARVVNFETFRRWRFNADLPAKFKIRLAAK